ncbi:MAG: Ppx/GppA family phosphatase [Oligoflexia bacterium]|nr:Ppx/GppA family phosphatase [Oligoflexia bacterium]
MSTLAAIDVGSNAIRLAIGSIGHDNQLTHLEDLREAVRLGDEVFTTGRISEELMRRAECAFQRFSQHLKRLGVEKVRAVGTSALREAHNRDVFVRRIQQSTGIRVSVISGEEEARLIHAAVAQRVDLQKKLALLIDIGGGSIEVTLVRDGDIIVSESVKMGTVRLLNLLGQRKQGQKIFYRLVRAYSEGLRRQLRKDLKHRTLDMCVGTGGNVEEFGDLRVALLKKSDPTVINSKELDQIVGRLESLSFDERVRKLSLRPDRADVIIPASIILQEILHYSGVRELCIPRVGLKDGILLDLVPEHGKRRPEQHRRQVLTYAHELGRRFSFDERHADTVAQFAVQLFDELKSVHKLPSSCRLVLEVAALLHDVGHCVNINGHHKHSYYLLKSVPFVGLSSLEKNLVAVVSRYHRKAPPKLEHPEFAGLPQENRDQVTKMAALLRIADALDSEHTSRVKAFRITKRGRRVTLSLRGSSDLLLERWAVINKSALFEDTFKLKVAVAA